MAKKTAWVDARDAAQMLDVTVPTLYAYVSRGLIRSEATAGPSRARRYSRDDVERLRLRAEERRHPEKTAQHALRWGMPVLESAITLIDDGRMYYRGHDVVTLAATRSIRDVASLLWTGSFEELASHRESRRIPKPVPALHPLPFVSRAQVMLASAAARDVAAFDLRPRAVARTGWRIVQVLTQAAMAGPSGSGAARPAQGADEIEHTLARGWTPCSNDAAALIRTALILCADHELNVSAFTARCVASAASNPYAVVIAALSALQGAKHGGGTARAGAFLESVRRSRDLRRAIAERLRRGEPMDGFGHPLYPQGDPRAALLLSMLPPSAETTFLRRFVAAAGETLGDEPNLDFSLVALERALSLPAGSALAIFGIGRSLGWIAHAIEQYGANEIIRPRARYVGPR